jgi:hypothetical protein
VPQTTTDVHRADGREPLGAAGDHRGDGGDILADPVQAPKGKA